MSIKKTLLVIGIALCFIAAGDRLYKFYQSHQPPFAVGECFDIEDPNVGSVNFKVMKNDLIAAETYAIGKVDFMPGVQIQVPVKITFAEIREAHATKAECR